jgi:hypothetical protein
MAFRSEVFKPFPYLPFFYEAWRSSPRVRRMTFEQRGLYLALLVEQWDQRLGSLPAALDDLAALVQVEVTTLAAHWPVLRQCFTVTRGGRLRNPKLAAVRASLTQWYARQREIRVGGACKSIPKVLSPKQLPYDLKSNLNESTKRARAPRAHLASARDAYLAVCPHEPPCQTVRLCGNRRDLDAALAAGRLDPAQAQRLLCAWGVEG